MQERISTGTVKPEGTRVDLRGHGNLSMTQAVDEYNAVRYRNAKPTVYKPISPVHTVKQMSRGADSAIVGQMVTGAVVDTTNELASKIAADFSKFKYGKVISKLF